MKKTLPYSVKVFGISFFCFLIAVLPMMISGNGLFMLYSDYNNQNLEFMSNLHYAIRNGGLGWDWYTDLGTSHLSSYSYYGLGSIYFWILMLLPQSLVLPAMPVMLALKTAVASTTAYLFIRRFNNSENASAVGGILYGFSGFILYNTIFYSFHDAISLFPLLLIAVELHVKDGKRGAFAAVTALCAVTNFYFFFGQVVFLLIYIAIRSTDKTFEMTSKKFLTLSIEAVLGTLVACVILYPSFVAVSASGRASERIALGDMFLYNGIGFYLRFLQMAVMSPDPCLISNLIETPQYKFGSLAIYLPLFSGVFALAYVRKHRKSWQTKLIAVSAVMALVPVLNSVFSLLSSTYYARWLYMPILIACLMTSAVTDNPDDYPVKSSFWVYAVLFLTFTVSLFIPVTDNGQRVPYFETLDKVLLVPQFAVTAALYIALAFVVFKLKRDRQFALNCVSFAAVGAIVFSCGFLYPCTSLDNDRKLIADNYKPETFDEYRTESFERIELIDAYSNFNMFWHLPSSRSYISLCNSSVSDFYDIIGQTYDVGTSYASGIFALRGLLSVKYVADDVPPSEISKNDTTGEATGYFGCTYDGIAGDFYIYENRHFIPMGIAYDSYITYDDIESLADSDEKAMALLEAVALTDDQIAEYGGSLMHFDVSSVSTDIRYYFDLCDKKAQTTCYEFKHSADGFDAKINLESGRLVLFSMPYDEGFSVTVNGNQADWEKVSGGLCAVWCEAGESEISARYKSKDLPIGIAMSAVGVAGLAVYLILSFRKSKHNKNS